MLDSAAFFTKFKGRGLMQSVVWTPAGGGTGATFEARLMASAGSSIGMIGGDEMAVQFITDDAPGIAQGDLVAIGGKTYKLRDRDRMNCKPDGKVMAYLIREVAP